MTLAHVMAEPRMEREQSSAEMKNESGAGPVKRKRWKEGKKDRVTC